MDVDCYFTVIDLSSLFPAITEIEDMPEVDDKALEQPIQACVACCAHNG